MINDKRQMIRGKRRYMQYYSTELPSIKFVCIQWGGVRSKNTTNRAHSASSVVQYTSLVVQWVNLVYFETPLLKKSAKTVSPTRRSFPDGQKGSLRGPTGGRGYTGSKNDKFPGLTFLAVVQYTSVMAQNVNLVYCEEPLLKKSAKTD